MIEIDGSRACEEDEAPETAAGRGGQGQPEPMPRPPEPIGGRDDHSDIDDDGPRLRTIGGDQQRRGERPQQAEPRQRRTMQRGGQHRGETRGAERDKREARADEAVKCVGGVDAAESSNRSGRGQDAGHISDGNTAERSLRAFATAQIFAGGDERRREDQAEHDPRTGSEKSPLDRISNQQERTERYGDAADPDRPACAERLFPTWFRRGRWPCPASGPPLLSRAFPARRRRHRRGRAFRSGFRRGERLADRRLNRRGGRDRSFGDGVRR